MGLTQTLPSEDQLTLSKAKAENMIAFLMGGYIAEDVILGQKTTGAGDDIDKATNLARRMVCEWGMSDAIGPVCVAKKEGSVFLGREMTQTRDVSPKLAETIDTEIRGLITDNYERAAQIVREKKDILHRMAEALLERETLNMEEIDLLMSG